MSIPYGGDQLDAGEWADSDSVVHRADDGAALHDGVPADRLSVVRLSDVKPERVSWLWPGRIPAG